MTVHIPKWLLAVLCVGAGFGVLYFSWAQEFIAIDRCLDQGGSYEALWETCNTSSAEPSRNNFTAYTGTVYSGALDEQKVQLQIRDDAQRYRMIKNGLRIEGDLNTENGIGKNDNEVAYVLNPQSEDSRKIRLLLSKTGSTEELVLIGPDRQLYKDVTLRARPPAHR